MRNPGTRDPWGMLKTSSGASWATVMQCEGDGCLTNELGHVRVAAVLNDLCVIEDLQRHQKERRGAGRGEFSEDRPLREPVPLLAPNRAKPWQCLQQRQRPVVAVGAERSVRQVPQQ